MKGKRLTLNGLIIVIAVTGETTITYGSLRKVHFFQAIIFESIGRFLIVWIYLRKVSLLFKSALDCITLLIS